MSRKNIVIICISAVILLIVSIWVGIVTTKPMLVETTNTPSPTSDNGLETQETSSDVTVTEEKKEYKITLSGTTLRMYFNDEILNETQIAPDVLPRTDVKALTQGIEYVSAEEALVDWESLCK